MPPLSPGTAGTVGTAGIGDPAYPLAGNGGYQVDSYDIDLSYDPPTNALQATAKIRATVTGPDALSQFNLDLQPTMTVSDVEVNGAGADFRQDRAELIVSGFPSVAAGRRMLIDVTYAGRPTVVRGTVGRSQDGGWRRTDSGGAFVAGEPISASVWYPANEHPADPAAFSVTATVPTGWQVISNGIRVRDDLPAVGPGESVFRWELRKPVPTYATTIYIDKFDFLTDSLSDGRPIVSAIGPGVQDVKPFAKRTAEIIDFLSGYFGPYPFDSAGEIFTDPTSTEVALETATRPIFTGDSVENLGIVVHELAHQWFGNDVMITTWSDICINECVASYAAWMWNEDINDVDLDERWNHQMRHAAHDRDFWSSPLVGMAPGDEFTAVYDRGPLAVHALRRQMGDDAFFAMLKKWPALYGGHNATFDEFEKLASREAGTDLGPFIDAWFRGTTVPDERYRYPQGLGG